MEKLSEHFSWEETIITEHRDIDNSLPIELYPTVKNTVKGMERVRAILNESIHINSWYRCRALNIAIGSNPDTTQHAKGEAVDFTSWKYGSCIDIVRKIIKYSQIIQYDQLILEYNWIHISFVVPPILPRLQVLTLLQSKKYAKGVTDLYGVSIA